MIKLPKGWKEETIGSKKVLKKIYKYKQTDSMDMINFAGDISELPKYFRFCRDCYSGRP